MDILGLTCINTSCYNGNREVPVIMEIEKDSKKRYNNIDLLCINLYLFSH